MKVSYLQHSRILRDFQKYLLSSGAQIQVFVLYLFCKSSVLLTLKV